MDANVTADFGPLLKIGKVFNTQTNQLEGDARFYVLYENHMALLVQIEAAVHIPILWSHAAGNLTIDGSGAAMGKFRRRIT